MTYSMASLLKKTIRGNTYYARECRRVDGQPKIVWQKYLGRADDIIAALTQTTAPRTTPPEQAVITEFGAVVAFTMWPDACAWSSTSTATSPPDGGRADPASDTTCWSPPSIAAPIPAARSRSPPGINARRCAASWTSDRSH
jgi:hypothetical protein